jgi:hypothetical protein
MAVEAFLINPVPQNRRSPKKAKTKAKTRAKAKVKATTAKAKVKATARSRRNPLGEEILILGGNPMKAKTKKVAARKSNPPQTNPRNKKRKSYRRKRSYRRNPENAMVLSSRKKRYRRNPGMISMPDITKPQTLIMPLILGISAKIATDKVPSMLNLSGAPAIAAQLGVAASCGILLKKVVGPFGAAIWVVVAGTTVIVPLLQSKLGMALSGDDIPYYPNMQYVQEPDMLPDNGMNAFPSMDAYPTDAIY